MPRAMSDPLGALCIVLHGHLPYVLHHGSYPHGEAWLYEAAAETYLPLLDVIGAAQSGANAALSVGLTPVLLEQLAHERFKTGFPKYLQDRAARAGADQQEFEAAGEESKQFAGTATMWQQWYEAKLEQFERIGRDIPGAFAGGLARVIQVLTSNATHAYMPLLLNDEMCRAQMSCGTATSARHLGRKSAGCGSRMRLPPDRGELDTGRALRQPAPPDRH